MFFIASIYAITLGKYFFKPNKSYLDYNDDKNNNDDIKTNDSYIEDDIE